MDKNHKINLKETLSEITDKKTLKAFVMVICGSIIYSTAVVWIFNLGNFLAGGAAGTAQLITGIISQLGGPQLSLGLFIFLINVPLFLIGFRQVSKKFAILTLVSIIVQTVTVMIFENIKFNPFNDPELANNRLLLALLGGGLAGLGASICLKSGGSSGGIDIISNYLMMKKNLSFTKYVFIIDFIIIVLAGFNFEGGISYEFPNAVYTLIRLIIYLIVVESIYTIYRPIKLQIVTTKPEEMRELMLAKIQHGMTIYKAIGAYTMSEKTVLDIYASSFELNDYIAIAQHVDEHAFITAIPVKTIKGNYIKKTIV